MKCYIQPEDYQKLTGNPFVLGKTDVPLFYGAACEDVNTVGGFANWVQDWEYCLLYTSKMETKPCGRSPPTMSGSLVQNR